MPFHLGIHYKSGVAVPMMVDAPVHTNMVNAFATWLANPTGANRSFRFDYNNGPATPMRQTIVDFDNVYRIEWWPP